MKKLTISEGVIGKPYYNKYNTKLTILKKTANSARVRVEILDMEKDVPLYYSIYDPEEDGKPGEVEPRDQPVVDEMEVPQNSTVKPPVQRLEGPSENKMTAKKLVWDLLKEGSQTRDSLAQAIVDAGLSQHSEPAKVKSYVSVILSHLKKKNNVPIVSLGPGKYKLEGQ